MNLRDMLSDLPQMSGIGLLHHLDQVGPVQLPVGGKFRFHPPRQVGVPGPPANAEVLQARDRRRSILPWLPSFRNDLDVHALVPQLVPAVRIVPDYFDSVVRSDPNQRVEVTLAD